MMVFWVVVLALISYLGMGYLVVQVGTALGAKAWVLIGVLLLAGGAGLLVAMSRMNRDK